MVIVKEVARSGARKKLREKQRICKDVSEVARTTVISVIELAQVDTKAKQKSSKLAEHEKDMQREL